MSMRLAFRIASLIPAAVTAAVMSAAAPVAAQDPEAADEALKKGNLAEAKTQYGQIIKGNPAEYNAVLAYASTLPPKEALKTADSLSRAQNVPGWVRARALRFSADHLFLKEEYKKAADAYLQASKSDTLSIYKHLYALSTAMDGQTESARAVWNAMALNKADELCGEATRLVALLPVSANNAATNAAKVDTVKTPPIPPATVGQPNNSSVSTISTVKVDTVKTLSTPTPIAPVSQPSNTQVSTPKATVGPQINAQPPAPVNTFARPIEPLFTVQVGAFASKDNADNLVKRLAGKYEDITVASAIGNDQILYKVRVGTFQRREDAAAFADRLIVEAGLSARVTDK